ncbi:hypothetical protein BJ944DRAFT_164899 [Cunninghamella echinulata]|nr:hypothetical protein BJ944DRAFT_164899 [Cunninghamella echinulata]
MARMFTNSIYYVHEKSNMVELNPSIPVSIPNERADPPETFKQNVDELVTDLVKKAKEIDILIEGLPGIERTEEEQVINNYLINQISLIYKDISICIFYFFIITTNTLILLLLLHFFY